MNKKDNEHALILTKGSSFHRQALRCFNGRSGSVLAKDLGEMIELCRQNVGATLLLDLSLFEHDVGHPGIGPVLEECAEQKVIVLTDDQDPAHLYKLFRQGARGFCQSKISDELLIKAVKSVEEGELWIGRKLTGYLMSQLILERSRNLARAQPEKLDNYELTPRESEIAHHIAKGKCDKTIARELAISPNTVKNHLSHIFGKLQIADRYQLALIYHGIDVG